MKKPKSNLLTKYLIKRGVKQLWVVRAIDSETGKTVFATLGKYKGKSLKCCAETHHDALRRLLVEIELIDWNEMKQNEQVD